MIRRSLTNPLPRNRREFLKAALVGGGVWATSPLIGIAFASSNVSTGRVPTARARISIDASHILHRIDPNIYGTFIEHVDRCVYGGVYQEGSPLSDAQGFRNDVMSAAIDWGVPILRWPGGNFADTYHWEDGVGPIASRPERLNRAWNEQESNHFGTDEFVEYCRKIRAEPYICVNLQNGTAQEAANWVEYCNGTGDTQYANLRRKYGHEQAYAVHYWGLGNEPWHMPTEKYANAAFEFGTLIKQTDPTVHLVACGMAGVPAGMFKKAGLDPEWNRVILEKLLDIADYISTHEYEGNDDYYEELGSVDRFENNLKSLSLAIDRVEAERDKSVATGGAQSTKNKKRIGIAYDEWNIWYRKPGLPRPHGIEEAVDEKYNLQDALWTASILNLFQRMADRVTMANVATMVNAIGTLYTNDRGMFRQTIFLPMKLYRRECGSLALKSNIDSPTFSTKDFKSITYLDSSATLDNDRKVISVAVVNRHREEPVRTTLIIRDARVQQSATAFEINGESPEIENSFTKPESVTIIQKQVRGVSGSFDYIFPAHSITLLKVTVA